MSFSKPAVKKKKYTYPYCPWCGMVRKCFVIRLDNPDFQLCKQCRERYKQQNPDIKIEGD